jgi:protein kinase A
MLWRKGRERQIRCLPWYQSGTLILAVPHKEVKIRTLHRTRMDNALNHIPSFFQENDDLARELAWDEPPTEEAEVSNTNQQRKTTTNITTTSASNVTAVVTLTDRERRQLYERQISRMNKLQNSLSDLQAANDDSLAASATTTVPTTAHDIATTHRSSNGSKGSNGSSDSTGSFRHDRNTIYGCGINTDDFHGSDDSEYTYPVIDKTEAQIQFLQNALHDNFIFLDVNETELYHFIMAMQSETISLIGTKIIQQGDMGDYFYIVESGTIDFVQEETDTASSTIVGSCTVGGSFGELALLYCSPRAVSCVTSSDTVVVWKIDHTTFRHIMAHQDYKSRSNLKQLIRSISIFQHLDETILSRFTKSLTPVHWKAGQRIVQKGEEGSVFYIIQSGSVKVHDIGLGDSLFDDLILGPGQYFGERALLTGEPRAANVTALDDVTTMAMDRTTFEASIGPLQNLLEREMRKQSLQVIPIFAHSDITNHEIELIADQMQEICYRKGEHLAHTGTPYQRKLWIIRHGRLVVYSQKYDKLYNLKAGDYFGDKSLMGDDPDHISSHTATCEENLTTWIITREQIESVIGDIHRLGQSVSFSKTKVNQSIPLKELKRVRILGQGAFGTVWLVTHSSHTALLSSISTTATKTSVYALKTISKAKIIDAKLDQAVIREKDLLSLLNHPFILNLVASYQDSDNLYLLLPLILGGELYSLLKKMKKHDRGMENNTVAFYAACIFEALKHFHFGHHIAYRDLKLENVLVDERGYGKIIDLGFAKVVTGKTYTLCGTPEMLAPEIIMSKGHDHAVDYWSFGVIVYELLVGHTPFYQRGSSQIDMFKRIVLVKYTTPDFVSDSAKSMIEKLLVRQQSHRLGNMANGYIDIKEQPWFLESGIDFKEILSQRSKAPWIPEIHDPLDASHFDDMSAFEHERPAAHRPLTRQEHEIFKNF